MGKRQQHEVQRLCGEVYIGIACLHLERELAEADASEDERVRMLGKAIEAADRAVELDSDSIRAQELLRRAREGANKLRGRSGPSAAGEFSVTLGREADLSGSQAVTDVTEGPIASESQQQ